MNFFDRDNYTPIPSERFRLVQSGEALKDEAFKLKPVGFYKDAFIRFCQNGISITAFFFICVIMFFAAFGPDMNPYTYTQQFPEYKDMPPRIPGLEKIGVFDGSEVLLNRRLSSVRDPEQFPEGTVIAIVREYKTRGIEMVDVRVDAYARAGIKDRYFWFGTDYLGRDLWTRLWRGARISLLIALITVAVNTFIGVIYGSVEGYYGVAVDMILMRITEILEGLPQLVLFSLLTLYFGMGMNSIILALVIRGWTGTARMIRAQFYRFKNREYVLAARTLGVPDFLLIFRHILPNSIGPVITRAMIAVPGAIFAESFLAYIGLGIQAPEPSIGVLLSDAQKTLLQLPFQTFFPAVLISILMVSFNLFSIGLREALDPTLRGEA